MELLFLCIAVAGFVSRSDCQSLTQAQFQLINPDLLYFEDNRPESSKKVDREVQTPSTELQPPVNRPNIAQLSIENTIVAQKPINSINVAQYPINDPSVVQRHSEEESNAEDVHFDQIAATLTNFSLNVIRNVNEQRSGNTVVSPYSIATLLSLLQQGATDQGLEQISVALQMSPQASAAAYKAQTQDFKSRSSRNILRTANSIFVANAFSLNPQFKAVAQRDFSSDVTTIVFERSLEAAQLINSWVASKTNNKIDKLISPDSIAANTQMMLVNAMYFKGLWEIPFRPQSTKPDTFHLASGAAKNIPFMLTRRYFKAGIDSQTDSRIIVLPFEREEYSLMIILPSMLSNAQDTLNSLTTSQLEKYWNLKSKEVQLRIPKFSIRADTDLTPVLQKMGVTQIFTQRSDLSGLGMYRAFTPQVSSAVHSAVLSIDEQGGSAAAASAFSVVALSNEEPAMLFKVDRPFIAVLWDGKSKIPLFVAKIEDPSL